MILLAEIHSEKVITDRLDQFPEWRTNYGSQATSFFNTVYMLPIEQIIITSDGLSFHLYAENILLYVSANSTTIPNDKSPIIPGIQNTESL